jgi:indole-3-glycerol phosphate synthase
VADILDEIVERKRKQLKDQQERVSFNDLQRSLRSAETTRSFASALCRDHVAIIAELKQASPSAGLIRQEADLASRMRAYERGGAAALSILTEESYFKGAPELLALARKETKVPLLRKDFIVDPYQIAESRQLGADAILLITTLLPGSLLAELIEFASECKLDALVETHSEADVELALKSKAKIIGINHRNLRTLQMDMRRAEQLLPRLPKKGITKVVESGIRTPAEARAFFQMGANAVLIGETLMRDPDPEAIVRQFTEQKDK